MKVNKIQQKSEICSQNFKALRIRQNSINYLSYTPRKILEKFDKIGKELADTKFYHLDIGKNEFFICHNNGEKLYLPILVNNAGKILLIKAKQGLSQITLKLKYDKEQKVNQICENIKESPTLIERTARIVKVIDDYEQNLHNNNKDLEINKEDSDETIVSKLIQKYGI